MIHCTSISEDAKGHIIDQGGQVLENGVLFPDGTESDALSGDLKNDNFENAEFILPDGLVLFLHRGHITVSKPVALTPAQFTAAKALAIHYKHLWSGVPDGTYNIEEIEKYSEPLDVYLPFGIRAPHINKEGHIVHTTGTGRLSWDIAPNGDTSLEVYRLYNDNVVCVASILALNEDESRFDMYIDNGISIRSSDDSLLFIRHVEALMDPIAVLLIAGGRLKNEEVGEKVQEWLAQLLQKAMPDPVPLDWHYNPPTGYDIPETYWTDKAECGQYAVFHRGDSFPVESEKTAVHAVLLLRENPEMDLVEAVKSAIKAKSYRPE